MIRKNGGFILLNEMMIILSQLIVKLLIFCSESFYPMIQFILLELVIFYDWLFKFSFDVLNFIFVRILIRFIELSEVIFEGLFILLYTFHGLF